MPKDHLVYDPKTKSFRSSEETQSFVLDEGPPAAAVPDSDSQGDVVSREKQYDPDTGELVRIKVHKRGTRVSRDKKGQSRQIQFALWIFIGLALCLWIGLVAVNFMAEGRSLEKVSEPKQPAGRFLSPDSD